MHYTARAPKVQTTFIINKINAINNHPSNPITHYIWQRTLSVMKVRRGGVVWFTTSVFFCPQLGLPTSLSSMLKFARMWALKIFFHSLLIEWSIKFSWPIEPLVRCLNFISNLLSSKTSLYTESHAPRSIVCTQLNVHQARAEWLLLSMAILTSSSRMKHRVSRSILEYRLSWIPLSKTSMMCLTSKAAENANRSHIHTALSCNSQCQRPKITMKLVTWQMQWTGSNISTSQHGHNLKWFLRMAHFI